MSADWITFKFETLNETPWNATVLSLAVLGGKWTDLGITADVDQLKENGEEYFFTIKNQKENYGRISSQDTIDWWKKQPIEAQNKVFRSESKVDLSQLPMLLKSYFKRIGGHDKTLVMLNGIVFHQTVMDSIFRTLGEKLPYEFWNVRDIRTILDTVANTTKLYGIDQYCEQKYDLKRHDSLDECVKSMLQTSYVLLESGTTLKEEYAKYGLTIYAKW